MPIYEYKCQRCGQVSEIIVRNVYASEEKACPNCGSHELKKLISVPGLVTKESSHSGETCCGRTERCDKPPCASEGKCGRH